MLMNRCILFAHKNNYVQPTATFLSVRPMYPFDSKTSAVLCCCCVNTGDDEQSDFYCEPDYPCASGLMAASMIAGARSRWKMEQFPSDSHMSRLHHDVCNHMTPSLRNTYKTRCKIMVRVISYFGS